MTAYITSFARDLVDFGVRFAYGISGSGSSLALIRELTNLGVQYVPVSHEASAALMAGAAGHDGKIRAVAISIKGPGFINMIPGILSNSYERRACVTVSEAYSSTRNEDKMAQAS